MDECDRIKSLIESNDQEVQFLGICLYCQLIGRKIPADKREFISEYVVGMEIDKDLFQPDKKKRDLTIMIANKYIIEYYRATSEYGK